MIQNPISFVGKLGFCGLEKRSSLSRALIFVGVEQWSLDSLSKEYLYLIRNRNVHHCSHDARVIALYCMRCLEHNRQWAAQVGREHLRDVGASVLDDFRGSEEGRDDDRLAQWEEWVKRKVEFYITSKQWDNITISQLNSWLKNFDQQSRKYALTLLNHFIFYPERDVKRLCYHALTHVIFKEELLDFDRRSSFACSNQTVYASLISLIKKCAIVPIWSEGNPSESGNTIARIYTTIPLIHQRQVLRPDQVLPSIYEGTYQRFLFVDDFLGSGDQVIDFWNEPSISLGSSGKKIPLSRIAQVHPGLSFEYVALVASTFGLNRVRTSCPELKLHVCEELTDEYRVFADTSMFFTTREERDLCHNYLKDLCQKKGIDLLGWHQLDFAVAFHHGAPNSCLPLFWKRATSWNQLVRRRM